MTRREKKEGSAWEKTGKQEVVMSHHAGSLATRVFGMMVALAVTLVAQVLAETPRFDVEILPVLETPQGILPNVVGVEMNDSGQVAGWALDSLLGSAAFRFTSGSEMLNLDPHGILNSTGHYLDPSGQVFGLASIDEPFLYTDAAGYDFIRDRPVDFFALELSDRGELIGITRETRPFIYSTAAGWLDLSDVNPLFQENPTFAKLINNDGDIVFTMNRPPGTQESSVLLNGRRLVDLGDFGFPMNVPDAIDRVGRIVGLAEKSLSPDASVSSRDGRQSRAYYFSPKLGVVDIHPKRFKDSYAGWIQSRGKTAGGSMARRRHDQFDTIFTYHPSSGMEIRATRREFKRFVRRRGAKLDHISITDMNDRLEFVGPVWSTDDDRDENPFATFLSRPEGGLHSLQDIVDAMGVEAVVEAVMDINNKGQILIGVALPDGRSSAAILTPSVDG